MDRTLQSTRRMGYLAVVCFRAAACPRVMEEATLAFRRYRIASVITTLKLAPGTDETKQKECLALLSFSLRLTPFKIKRSWKKMSLWIGPIMSTVSPSHHSLAMLCLFFDEKDAELWKKSSSSITDAYNIKEKYYNNSLKWSFHGHKNLTVTMVGC